MQLINAYEYKMNHGKPTEKHHLRIFYHFEARRRIFEKCLSGMEWDNVSFSYSFQKIGAGGSICVALNLLVEYFYQLYFRKVYRKRFSELVFGHYTTFVQRGYLKNFNGKITLVDDGNFSFHVHALRSSERGGKKMIRTRKNDRINGFFEPLFYADLGKRDIHFFTAYPIPEVSPDKVLRNTYESWGKLLKDGSHTYDKTCWIIGGDYSEKAWMTEEDYLACMINIAEQNEGYTIKYVKKWSESEAKLAKLPATMEITTFDLPMEIMLINTATKPVKVYGFISSVLFNMSGLFEGAIEFNMIVLDETKRLGEGRAYLSEVYEQASTFPVRKIPMEL